MQYTISKEYKFEAAHILPEHPGRCKNLHGHSYKMTVWVKTHALDELGFVVDYGDLSSLVKDVIISLVDHSFIHATAGNHKVTDELVTVCDLFKMKVFTIPHAQSSAENLAFHFAQTIADAADLFFGKARTFELQFKVLVKETASSSAETPWITGNGGDWLS